MKIKDIIEKLKKYRGNEDIGIDELNELTNTNSNLTLLDVRSTQEYSEGHLERSNKYTIIRIGNML